MGSGLDQALLALKKAYRREWLLRIARRAAVALLLGEVILAAAGWLDTSYIPGDVFLSILDKAPPSVVAFIFIVTGATASLFYEAGREARVAIATQQTQVERYSEQSLSSFRLTFAFGGKVLSRRNASQLPNEVAKLQILLTSCSHPTDVDGVFGPNTEERVKECQAALNLPANGAANELLWNRLVERLTDPSMTENLSDIYKTFLEKRAEPAPGVVRPSPEPTPRSAPPEDSV